MDKLKWQFTNPETGEKEAVNLERWIWAVVYSDGTELHQFDDDGVFHRIAEIDQSRVIRWVLYQPQGVGNGRIDFFLPEGKEVSLIHKYKNFVFNAATPSEYRSRVYQFGYKVKGGQPHLNLVMPNDIIIQTYGDRIPSLAQAVSSNS